MSFYSIVYGDTNEFIYHSNIVDRNMAITDFPEDHTNDVLRQYQTPYPKFGFNVNMFFDPKYKDKVMEKLRNHNPDLSKERLASYENF